MYVFHSFECLQLSNYRTFTFLNVRRFTFKILFTVTVLHVCVYTWKQIT